MDSPESLCLACGLCCDGTLFDNVRLGPGDRPSRLQALQLPVRTSRAKPPVTFFRQPCAALCADGACRVYADRPRQCRSYECQVYQQARDGRLSFASARRLVRRARREADHLRDLLRQLGDTDETRSLHDRFRRTQQRLQASGADAKTAGLVSELGLAMHAFDLLAHRKFHTRSEKAPA